MAKKRRHSRKSTRAKRTRRREHVLLPKSVFEILTEPLRQDVEREVAAEHEVAEFTEQHFILSAIWNRYAELARDIGRLPNHSPERKKLEQSFRKLEAYLEPMYEKPKPEQERMILGVAQAYMAGEFLGLRRPSTWQEVKEFVDGFAKRIRSRPVGRPIRYRPRIVEALEIKFAHPDRTWEQIRADLKLRISIADLKRQINLLRNLLKGEKMFPIRQYKADDIIGTLRTIPSKNH